MAKDKFKSMQQGGGAPGSFQDMVAQATTVAAIEKQAVKTDAAHSGTAADVPVGTVAPTANGDVQRYMRLPNPQIPIAEYNLVTRYCEQFSNMTRQDFVEMAIIEKLHAEGLLAEEDYAFRSNEIRSRPPRGHRKGMKISMSK